MSYGTMTLKGKRYILVPEAEFDRMTRPGDAVALPALPPADRKGRRPAVAFAGAALARNLVRDREFVGLSREQLAAAAGIRVELLTRAEAGTTLPSERTLVRIEAALASAGLKRPDPRTLDRL